MSVHLQDVEQTLSECALEETKILVKDLLPDHRPVDYQCEETILSNIYKSGNIKSLQVVANEE